jgi:hypothetical protein
MPVSNNSSYHSVATKSQQDELDIGVINQTTYEAIPELGVLGIV